jgi:hypothetical protein
MADKNPFANVGLSQFGSEGAAGGLGQDILSGATAYAIDKSGLKDYLNSIGVSKNEKGTWGYSEPKPPTAMPQASPIAGAAAPNVPPAPVAPVAPVMSVPAPVAPNAGMTIKNGTGIADQPYVPLIKPNDAGSRLLNGDWHGSDSGQNPQQTTMADASAKQFVPSMGGGSQGPDLMKLAQMFLMG